MYSVHLTSLYHYSFSNIFCKFEIHQKPKTWCSRMCRWVVWNLRSKLADFVLDLRWFDFVLHRLPICWLFGCGSTGNGNGYFTRGTLLLRPAERCLFVARGVCRGFAAESP